MALKVKVMYHDYKNGCVFWRKFSGNADRIKKEVYDYEKVNGFQRLAVKYSADPVWSSESEVMGVMTGGFRV